MSEIEQWEIPNNWKWAQISELGTIVAGGTPSTKEPTYWGNDINWISPADLSGYNNKLISKGAKSLSKKGLEKSSAKLMPSGSIHFSSRAPIGYVVISKEEMSTNQGFKSLVPADGIFNEYVYYFLKSAKQLAENRASGTTFKELSGKAFSLLPIPIAPYKEQLRIVAKIEQLFSDLDNGIANLKKAQEQLKIYRQAVLKKAFEGGFNKGITEFKEVVVNGIKSKIPTSWQLKKLGDYAKLQGGFAFKSKEYTETGIPLVKISNVHHETIDWTEKSFIASKRLNEFKEYQLFEGDILIAMTRPIIKSLNTVKAVVVKYNDLPALLNQRVGRFIVINQLDKKYLKYFLYTDFFKQRVLSESSSTQQPNISSKKIENFDFIFPNDVNLQHQIVREIETRLSVCDKLEETIAEALQKSEALRQSILKRAFEGKLLSEKELEEARNAPDWEPADKLLERIKAEKEKPGTKKSFLGTPSK